MTAHTQNCDNASKNFAGEPDDRTSFGMAGIGTSRTSRDVRLESPKRAKADIG